MTGTHWVGATFQDGVKGVSGERGSDWIEAAISSMGVPSANLPHMLKPHTGSGSARSNSVRSNSAPLNGTFNS